MKYTFILLLLLIASCSNNNHDAHEGESGSAEHSDEVRYKVTMYSGNMELFMEYKPLIKNEETSFTAHFTHLDGTYKPVTKGRVTFVMDYNGNAVKSEGEPGDADGIYKTSLKIPNAKSAALSIYIQKDDIRDTFRLGELNIYDDLHEAKHQEGLPNAITFLKEQAWRTEFNVEPAMRKSFSSVIKVSGQINSAIGDESMIVASVSGRVKAINPNLLIGSGIKKGNNVFAISTGDFGEGNLNLRYSEAKANYDKAKDDLSRAESLLGDKIISNKDYVSIKAEFEKSESILKSLTNDISDGVKYIKSPISGYIKKIYIHDGDYVTQGQVLASVSKNQSLILSCDLPPNFSDKLSEIDDANFMTLNDNNVYSIKELRGKKAGFGKSADNLSFYIPVYFEFNNPGEFIPGTYAEVYLKTREVKDALMIPMSSLTEEAGLFYVYIQAGGESFLKREVTIGESDGINVIIKSGLNGGERVVTRGAVQVKMASGSSSIPHGHAH